VQGAHVHVDLDPLTHLHRVDAEPFAKGRVGLPERMSPRVCVGLWPEHRLDVFAGQASGVRSHTCEQGRRLASRELNGISVRVQDAKRTDQLDTKRSRGDLGYGAFSWRSGRRTGGVVACQKAPVAHRMRKNLTLVQPFQAARCSV